MTQLVRRVYLLLIKGRPSYFWDRGSQIICLYKEIKIWCLVHGAWWMEDSIYFIFMTLWKIIHPLLMAAGVKSLKNQLKGMVQLFQVACDSWD